MSATMSVVWHQKDDEGYQLGAVSDHFMAIWGDEDGNAHATFCHPAEWQPLADRIEEVCRDFLPLRPIWEWPKVEPEDPAVG